MLGRMGCGKLFHVEQPMMLGDIPSKISENLQDLLRALQELQASVRLICSP